VPVNGYLLIFHMSREQKKENGIRPACLQDYEGRHTCIFKLEPSQYQLRVVLIQSLYPGIFCSATLLSSFFRKSSAGIRGRILRLVRDQRCRTGILNGKVYCQPESRMLPGRSFDGVKKSSVCRLCQIKKRGRVQGKATY